MKAELVTVYPLVHNPSIADSKKNDENKNHAAVRILCLVSLITNVFLILPVLYKIDRGHFLLCQFLPNKQSHDLFSMALSFETKKTVFL